VVATTKARIRRRRSNVSRRPCLGALLRSSNMWAIMCAYPWRIHKLRRSASGSTVPSSRGADDLPTRKSHRYLRFLSAAWNLSKVLGFRMTASFGIRLAGPNSDPRPKTKRSNEFRFGARRRARLLMSNYCFINKDSATKTRTPPGRTSLAMVASRWTASMSRELARENWTGR
jgi:hypothetical protein